MTIATLVLAALPLVGCDDTKAEYQTVTATPIAVNSEYGHGCGVVSIAYGDTQAPLIAQMSSCGLSNLTSMQDVSDVRLLLDLAIKDGTTIQMTGTPERNGKFDVTTLLVGGHQYTF